MYLNWKRKIDFILAWFGFVVLSPVFLLIIVLIKLDSKGSVLFKQKRVGIHKSHFQIMKFRTMRGDTPSDCPTHLLSNPERHITRVGKFLRKTSLDELPQIFNIMYGDMSIVGPRPALWNQSDLVRERDKYGANNISPGLTGWAQIHGRDELSISKKARLDGWYVKNISLRTDVFCLVKTFSSVIKQDGVKEGKKGGIGVGGIREAR